MNIAAVADTHAALWYLLDDERLSLMAKRFIEQAAAGDAQVGVATISLAEIVYLVEKGRVPASAYEALRNALANRQHVFVEIVLSGEVTDAMRQVSRAEVPDMPDRIIAATGISLGVPVISRDGRIQASTVRTIW